MPGECFPTRYRSTCHGLSAASGKVGAVLAQALTGPLLGIGFTKGENDASPWLPHIIQILGGFAFLGLLSSFLIPETMGRSLENLAGEEPAALDDEEDEGVSLQSKSFLERTWVSCTPVELYRWVSRRRRSRLVKDCGGERASSQVLKSLKQSSGGIHENPADELADWKFNGEVKMFEATTNEGAGERSRTDRRDDDEIRQMR